MPLTIPSEYRHLISGRKLSGGIQRDIILCIAQTTIGAPGKPEWAPLSMGKLAAFCGVVDRSSICKGLIDLERRAIIASKRMGPYVTNRKAYKLLTENWSSAPAYKAVAEPKHKEVEKYENPGFSEPITEDGYRVSI